jgi:hypothetical protein
MNGNDIGITVYWNIVFDLIYKDFDSKNMTYIQTYTYCWYSVSIVQSIWLTAKWHYSPMFSKTEKN